MQAKSKNQLKSTNKPLKYKCFAITLFVLMASNSFGQSTTWQRIFTGPYPASNEYGYASCRADGDNLYILGSISNAQIFLLKINPLGDTLWTKIIGNAFSRGRAIVESDSGSCVLTGDIENGQAFSIKVNKNGNIVWQKYYGGNLVQIYDIKVSNGNGFLLCGSSYPLDAIVLKINSNGDLIWSKTFTAGYKINFQSLIETEQNDIIMTGWKSNNSSLPTNGLIFKIDSVGNFIWDTVFNFNNSATGGRKIIITDSGFSICGEIFFGKIFFLSANKTGKIVHSNIFDSTYRCYDIGGFNKINSNRFIVNYSQDSISLPVNGKVIIFDSLGAIIKSKLFTCLKQITFGSITQLSDTGFIFFGSIDNNTSSEVDLYAIKSDTSLNAQPVLGINQNINELPIGFILFQNFPNPFNPVTNIKYEIPRDENVSIKIYDLLGKEVFRIYEYKKAGSYEVQFDGANFASGMYFYQITAGNFTDTKKMVMIK